MVKLSNSKESWICFFLQAEHAHHQAPTTYNQYGVPQEHQLHPTTAAGQEKQQQDSHYQNQPEYTQNTETYNKGVDPNAYQNAGVDPNSQWSYQRQFHQNGSRKIKYLSNVECMFL